MGQTTVKINGIGKVKLTDKNFIGEGGQAKVYKYNDQAVKIYHDKNDVIPEKKIQELKKLNMPNVLAPKELVYDSNNNICGYTMDYVADTSPICRMFTKSFKKQNSLDTSDIVDFVKEIQSTIKEIHKNDCVIVDLNEMNILASQDFKTPLFIDVDSYKTPSYNATAIMESIRDPKVTNNNFTRLSDWYSFAIIAFQMYIGIHPFKGKHPNYKPNQWQQRMKDGVSVFDKKASLPSICNDFSVIPKAHLDWMKEIFVENKRSIPPTPSGAVSTPIKKSTIIITGNEGFLIDKYFELDEEIEALYDFVGAKYFLTKSSVYKGKQKLSNIIENFYKVILCKSSDVTPIVCKHDLKSKEVIIEKIGGAHISTMKATRIMEKNGCLYVLYNGNLSCVTFNSYGNKIVPRVKIVSQVSELACKVFDGAIAQSLLGQPFLVIPFSETACTKVHIPELKGYKIIDMKCEKQICILSVSKNGIYSRLIITFDEKFKHYTMRVVDDLIYEDINFTVLPSNVCVYVSGDKEIEVFVNSDKVKKIDNPPFSSYNKLYNFGGHVYFIDKNTVYQTEMKK